MAEIGSNKSSGPQRPTVHNLSIDGQRPQLTYKNWYASIVRLAQSFTDLGVEGLMPELLGAEEFSKIFSKDPPRRPRQPSYPKVNKDGGIADDIMARYDADKKRSDHYVVHLATLRAAILNSNNCDENLFECLADPDANVGMLNVTVQQLMKHVKSQYGELTDVDLERIKLDKCREWNFKTETIEVLAARLKLFFAASILAQKTVSDLEQVKLFQSILIKEPRYGKEFKNHFSIFQSKYEDNRKLDQATTFMARVWTDIQRDETVEQADLSKRSATITVVPPPPFGTANNAVAGFHFETVEQVLQFAAAAQQSVSNNAARGHSTPTASDKYCWSHGLGNHTSLDCNAIKAGYTGRKPARAGHPRTPAEATHCTYAHARASELAGTPTGCTRPAYVPKAAVAIHQKFN
jgi:hypothetical protein